MATHGTKYFLGVLLVGSMTLTAGAQREAVKNKAGDATETKAAPPKHAAQTAAGTDAQKAGKGDKSVAAADAASVDESDNGDAGAAAKTAKGNGAKMGGESGPDGGGGNASAGMGGARRGGRGPGGGRPGGDAEPEKTVYSFGLPGADGKNIPLTEYKGKVIMLVNLGRKSSYNAQLAGLEKLNDQYKDKGLVIIGVPSNDFGAAEPGTDAEIAEAYTDAKVNFLIAEKSPLTGVHELPLYDFVTKEKSVTDNGLHWNYTKFLIDRKGKVLVRLGPDVDPQSLEMQSTVQAVLDGTWKAPKGADAPGGRRGGGGMNAEAPEAMM